MDWLIWVFIIQVTTVYSRICISTYVHTYVRTVSVSESKDDESLNLTQYTHDVPCA